MASGWARWVMASALLLLIACASPQEKASKAAARYDIFYAQRDFYSARIEIKRALAAQDDIPEYWAKLARVELATGQLLDAYDAYSRLIELEPQNSEAIAALAELSYSGGSFDDADKFADQFLEKQPRSLRMMLVKGSVAAARQDAPRARAIAEDMLSVDPSNEGAKVLLARVLTMGGDREGAIALLEKAIADDGESTPKLLALVDLYIGKDDFPKAAGAFARLFALLPADVDLRIEYARLLYDHDRPDRALEVLGRLGRSHAGDPTIERRIVDLWSDVGSDRIDLDRVRSFVERTGNDRMKIALGHLMLDQKRYADAAAVLRSFVDGDTITPERVEADVLYAGALSGLGKGGEALALIDRILRFDENNPRALLMRVRVAMATGDLASALRDAQVLARDNPRLVDGRVALAEIYVRRRETVLADNAYAAAMNELSDNADMLEAYVAYLLRNKRNPMALDIAKRFTRANKLSRDGWRVRADLCLTLDDQVCVDQALFILRQMPGTVKIVRSIEQRRPARPVPPPGRPAIKMPTAGQAAAICGRAGAEC